MLLLDPYRFGGAVDPFFSSNSILLHFDGTDGATSFPDSSSYAKSATRFGDTQIDTAYSKFGGASGLFDGTGDYLEFAYHASLDLSAAGDFTLELQYRPNSIGANQMLVAFAQRAAPSGIGINYIFEVLSTGTVRFAFYTVTTLTTFNSTGTLTAGTFYHLAITRSGNVYRIFIDGVLDGTVTTASAINGNVSTYFILGKYQDSDTRYANGWMDELRLTKGTARYTADFTPPAAAFPDS